MERLNRQKSKHDRLILKREIFEFVANLLKFSVIVQIVAIVFKTIAPELANIESLDGLYQFISDSFTDFVLYSFGITFAVYAAVELMIIRFKALERKYTHLINDLDQDAKAKKHARANNDLKRVLLKRRQYRDRIN